MLLRKVYGGLRNVRNRILLLDEAVGALSARCLPCPTFCGCARSEVEDLAMGSEQDMASEGRRRASRLVRASVRLGWLCNGRASGDYSRCLWMLDLLRKVYGGLRNVRNRI